MGKQSGLGDACWVDGNDLSGDTQSVQRVAGGPAPLDFTTIDKSAMVRQGGVRDGGIDWTSFFDDAATSAHPVLSTLPTADRAVTYCRGAVIGSAAACLIGKQINYDGNRAQDGSFILTVQAQANGFGLEWGNLLTAGKRTDTGATNGTSLDGLASSAFGLQAYLHVFAFTGTDATVKLQESSDNGAGDAFADVVGGGFTAVTAGPTSQRIATASGLSVERYLRVVTTTSAGFTSLTFGVVVVRNATAVSF